MKKRCCSDCAYAVRPMGRWFRVFLADAPGLLACLNHPDSPGQLTGVSHCSCCPNYRARRKPPVRITPPEPPDDSVRYIPLTQGKIAIVDAADYEWLSRHKWHAVFDAGTGTYYARRNTRNGHIVMHREIMQTPKDEVADHKDGNGLDNRRCNLRNCTRPENSRNRRRNRGTVTGFKGVWLDKKRGKYYATIQFEGKAHYLGQHLTAIEAARAYDRKAIELFGPFARPNLPEEHPEHQPTGR